MMLRGIGPTVATNGHYLATMSGKASQQDVTGTIYVDYRIVGDWHVFTSDQVRGLYVAHSDRRTAYEAICPTIEKLLSENEHIDVKVRPAIAFDAFLDRLRRDLSPAEIVPGKKQAFTLMAASS